MRILQGVSILYLQDWGGVRQNQEDCVWPDSYLDYKYTYQICAFNTAMSILFYSILFYSNFVLSFFF